MFRKPPLIAEASTIICTRPNSRAAPLCPNLDCSLCPTLTAHSEPIHFSEIAETGSRQVIHISLRVLAWISLSRSLWVGLLCKRELVIEECYFMMAFSNYGSPSVPGEGIGERHARIPLPWHSYAIFTSHPYGISLYPNSLLNVPLSWMYLSRISRWPTRDSRVLSHSDSKTCQPPLTRLSNLQALDKTLQPPHKALHPHKTLDWPRERLTFRHLQKPLSTTKISVSMKNFWWYFSRLMITFHFWKREMCTLSDVQRKRHRT